MIEIIQNYEFHIEGLKNFRNFGFPRLITEQKMEEWILFLLEEIPKEGAFYALNSISFYYDVFKGTKILPRDFTLRVLRDRSFKIATSTFDLNKRMYQTTDKMYFMEVAKRLLDQHSQTFDNLFDIVIDFAGMPYNYTNLFHDTFNDLLTHLTQNNSEKTWYHIKKILVLKHDSRQSFIIRWFARENRGIYNIELFDHIKIIAWVNEDVDIRAKLIASIIPSNIFNADKNFPRKFLEIFGNRSDVRKSFSHNYYSGKVHSYLPEKTNPYMNGKQMLEELLEKESNENIRIWIREYISKVLEHDIERSEKHKERKGSYGI